MSDNSLLDPDIIDLQFWMQTCENEEIRQAWEASKYLSAPYTFWLSVWRLVGSPDIA